jgi:hypothetical protein
LLSSSDTSKYCDFTFVTTPDSDANNVKQYSYKSGCFDGTISNEISTATIAEYANFNQISISLNTKPYFVIDSSVASKLGFNLANFLGGTLTDYTFGITSFEQISADLDNGGLPKLSSNKLKLLFVSSI